MDTKLKAKRQEQGLTQEQVAGKAKVTIQCYQNYESGKRIPRADTAKVIATFLHSTVEELF